MNDREINSPVIIIVFGTFLMIGVAIGAVTCAAADNRCVAVELVR